MKFLIIDDNPTDQKLITWTLQKKFKDSEFVHVIQQNDFHEAIIRDDFDVVITECFLGWTDGLQILKKIKERFPYLPVIMVTNTKSEEFVTEGMKFGLSNFILKTNLDILPAAVKDNLEKLKLLRMYDEARSYIKEASDAMFVVNTEGNLLEVNKKAEELTGYTRQELINMNFTRLHPKEELEKIVTPFKEAMLNGAQGSVNDTLLLRKDGKVIPIDITGSVIEFEGKKVGQAIIRDVTYRKQIEQRLGVQYAVGRIMVESATPKEAVPKILQAICEYLEWDLGLHWNIDKETNVLRLVEVWHNPLIKVTEFVTLSKQTIFSPGIGLPGRIWASGKPCWIPDVVSDANFPLAPIAAKEGLHGAFGFPIMLGNEILGVLEFFSHEIQQPDEGLFKLMASIGGQISQFIERKKTEESLRRRIDYEKTIASISSRFVYSLDFDNDVSRSLADIGRYAGVDKACFFQFHDNGTLIDKTHEWRNKGIAPQILNPQNLPTAKFPWWMAKLRAGNAIHIPYISQIPPEAVAEIEQLEREVIKSLMALPVYAGKELAGFICFEKIITTCTCNYADMNMLRIVTEILGNAISRKQSEAVIVQMAYHDALTNLPNRILFQDRLQVAVVHAKRNEKIVAVMLLDLDNFKNINDSLGHHRGDLLLKAVAKRLKQYMREGDTVARMGGDEFTVILPDLVHAQDAAIVAQKILDALQRPFHVENRELHTTASIGISVYPLNANNTKNLIKQADIAMYSAKRQGKNTYRFYNDDMNIQMQ
jgi:diguanylate cyclase (GGDEF)-like protein/PAS domain S-box-containing protein